MENDPISLSQRFPIFANDNIVFAKKADAWLERMKKTKATIFQQLDNRKINRICIIPCLCTAGLGIKKGAYEGAFCAYFNTYCKLEWAFEALGHEIAHTFHFDLTKNPPLKTVDDQSNEFMYDFDGEGDPQGFLIEDFCDNFAKRWLTINTKEKVEADYKNNENVLASIILMFSNNRAEN